jgi:hypothetical protein
LNSPGGMVTWFRRLEPDKPLNKNQLLRFAYRCARRLYAFAAANKIQIYEKVENCLVDFTDEQAIQKLADTF